MALNINSVFYFQNSYKESKKPTQSIRVSHDIKIKKMKVKRYSLNPSKYEAADEQDETTLSDDYLWPVCSFSQKVSN